MRAHKIVVAGLIAMWFLGAPTIASAQSAPPWTVGDSWQVGVWQGQAYINRGSGAATSQETYNPKGRMIAVSFQITGTSTVSDKECFEVAVVFPQEDTGFQRRYQLYYTKDTGNLLRVKDTSITRGGTSRDSVVDYSAKSSGPTSTMDIPCLVPLDWPDWTRQNVPAPPQGTRRTSQTTTPGSSASANDTGSSTDQITLTTQVGQKEVKVVQQWTKGQPWWSQAKKYDNGRLVADAILLEVNGQKVADMPPKAP